MKSLRFLLAFLAILLVLTVSSRAAGNALERHEWTIDGVVREALIAAPASAKTAPAPVVFAFHGHGGNMNQAARSFGYHNLWPEAIVVYMQGLNTVGKLVDPEGTKPGWQSEIGLEGDRDLKFFDAVLATLEKDYRVNEKHVYSTGHSNGGGFTYLLWAARGDKFAAMAPSSAVLVKSFPLLKPKPVLHVAGQNDELVKYAWQERMMDALRKLNQCGEGVPQEQKYCTLYPSKLDAPVVTLIHPGTHQFYSEAPAAIVKFFKEH